VHNWLEIGSSSTYLVDVDMLQLERGRRVMSRLGSMIGVFGLLAACTNPLPGNEFGDPNSTTDPSEGSAEGPGDENGSGKWDRYRDAGPGGEGWPVHCEKCVGCDCIYRCEPYDVTEVPPDVACDGVFEFCQEGSVFSLSQCACAAAL
jgi:hypothetical protein